MDHIFRMIHVDNIPHILEAGLTHHASRNANENFRSIGDSTLISTRYAKTVLVTGSNDRITLGNYIPFYFGVRTPMLYVMQKGSNSVPDKVSPEEIIYCVVRLLTLIEKEFTIYFSDGHATDGYTRFYSKDKIEEIDELVDSKAIWAKYWHDEKDLDLKRRKQAELLVSQDIPFDCIAGFIVYNEKVKSMLEELGVESQMVHVKSNYYF